MIEINLTILILLMALLTGAVWYMQRKYDQINQQHAKKIKALAAQQYHTSKLLLQLIKENKEQKREIEKIKR